MERETGMLGRVEIVSGALDGMEGTLQRLYWEGASQMAEVLLADGQRITIEVLRRETAAETMPPREFGS